MKRWLVVALMLFSLFLIACSNTTSEEVEYVFEDAKTAEEKVVDCGDITRELDPDKRIAELECFSDNLKVCNMAKLHWEGFFTVLGDEGNYCQVEFVDEYGKERTTCDIPKARLVELNDQFHWINLLDQYCD